MAIFSKNLETKKTTFQIQGMHCVSCAMCIDGCLEDTPGVIKAETNFAKSLTNVSYDPKQLTTEKVKEIIEKVGYHVTSTLDSSS